MPRVEFTRELTVASTPEQAWETLTDITQLIGWVSAIEEAAVVVPLERYTAVMMDRLGPFKLRADLDIEMTDVVIGNTLRILGSGEDRHVGSRLVVDVTLTMTPNDTGSTVLVGGFYEVTGKAASMGPGPINKKADKILDDFFAAAGEALGAV